MLINLRNALMSGKRLPYDAEVEYLESTGTQWINTGYMLSGPTTFKLSASFTPTSNERDFFGAHSANAQGATVCGCYRNFVFGYNYPHARIDGASLGSSEITTDIEYALSQSSRTLKVNGTTYSGNGATFPNLAVTLFRGNSNTAYYGQFKCYAFQIYDTNGTLVRDFIPVRKKTVGYLYDRVSGKLFGNAGTGDFVVGQDVMPVEYIESGSNHIQVIDTGFYANQNTKSLITFEKLGADGWLFGSRNGSSSATDKFGIFVYQSPDGKISAQVGNTYIEPIISGGLTYRKKTIELSLADGVTVDGETIATFSESQKSQTFTSTYPMALFNMRVSSSGFNSGIYCRVYAYQIFENGLITHNFLPVRVGTGSTWEGAMMDTITRRIYRNAGTGAFAYGNDLKYPIPAE